MCGSPGVGVMGGDSCSKGSGFESQPHILDGHFSHIFVVEIVMFVWKDKSKWKKVGDGPFKKCSKGRHLLVINKMAKQMFQQKIISVGTDLKSGAIGYLNESKVKSKSTDRQKIRR